MPARDILYLWFELENFELEEIVNDTKGGPGAF